MIMNKVDKYDIFNVGCGEGKSVDDILYKCMDIEDYHPEVI